MLHDNLSISPEKTASRPSEVKSTSLEKLPLILSCAHTASQNRLKFYLQVLSTTKFIFKCSLSPSWQIVSFLFFGPHMRMEQTGKKPACRLVYPPVSTLWRRISCRSRSHTFQCHAARWGTSSPLWCTHLKKGRQKRPNTVVSVLQQHIHCNHTKHPVSNRPSDLLTETFCDLTAVLQQHRTSSLKQTFRPSDRDLLWPHSSSSTTHLLWSLWTSSLKQTLRPSDRDLLWPHSSSSITHPLWSLWTSSLKQTLRPSDIDLLWPHSRSITTHPLITVNVQSQTDLDCWLSNHSDRKTGGRVGWPIIWGILFLHQTTELGTFWLSSAHHQSKSISWSTKSP